MRSIAHWTPRYVWARGREIVDHRLNPYNPWLTREAVRILQDLLLPSDIALEFGGGRSTPWLAKRVKHLTSVDHNPEWHQIVREKIAVEKISNVELILREKDVVDADGSRAAYVRVLEGFPDLSIDFCLVDGMYRDCCALNVLRKLSAGSLLVIDNANWYLPSASCSPGSRSLQSGTATRVWQEFMDTTVRWRRIWTFSGVTDTVLYFKP